MGASIEPGRSSTDDGGGRSGEHTGVEPLRVEPLRTEELESEYVAYRVRQARGFIQLIPREGVRPLLRQALATATDAEQVADDPMGTLLRHCLDRLPLPPFEVWLADRRAHPSAHVGDIEASASAPTAATPLTVEARGFTVGREGVSARLRVFRDAEAWRGFIAFEGDRRGVHATSVIFREPSLEDVRERFRSFDFEALSAFYRSACA